MHEESKGAPGRHAAPEAPEREAAPEEARRPRHAAPEAPEREAAPVKKKKPAARNARGGSDVRRKPAPRASEKAAAKKSAPEKDAAPLKKKAPEGDAAPVRKKKPAAKREEKPERDAAPLKKKRSDRPEGDAAPLKKKRSAPQSADKPEKAAPLKRKKPAPERPAKTAAARKKKRARDIEDYLDSAPREVVKRPTRQERKRRRARRNTAVLLVSLAIALLCGALYAGACVTASETNLPNVYLDGFSVGGLTKEETAALLAEQDWDAESRRPLTVALPGGFAFEIDRVKAGSALPLQRAVNAAYAYGHSGFWLGDLASWLRCKSSPVNLGNFAVTLDEDYIQTAVRQGLDAFREAMTPDEPYTVDKENACLRLRKGAGQVRIDPDKLCASVREALLGKADSLSFDELEELPAAPDFEAIYQALDVEAQDAYFTEDWEVVDEVVGCTFGVEQAVSIWEQTPWLEEALIPLAITYPEKTGENLRAALFRDKLGEQTSYFPNSIQNRISNIELAASKIDGTVLKPGETFSYNEALGERTLENGFLLAGAYSNGEVVEEIGGGICQVSSTLYCAVLYSQLGITSRDSHYFKVDYLPWGQDATVSWPKPDFKFTNTRDYPIRIHAVADPVGRSITAEIWGTDNLGTHIELFEDRYTIYDETWGVATGWNVYLFARVYDAEGNLLETRELPISTYHKHDEDIEWPAAKYEADAAGNIEIG